MKGRCQCGRKKRQDDSKRKRKNQIIIRCSDEELSELNRATEESGLSRTDFILSVLHNGSVIIIEDLQDICIELKKQGINLNQALRFAYQYGDNEEIKKQFRTVTTFMIKQKTFVFPPKVK